MTLKVKFLLTNTTTETKEIVNEIILDVPSNISSTSLAQLLGQILEINPYKIQFTFQANGETHNQFDSLNQLTTQKEIEIQYSILSNSISTFRNLTKDEQIEFLRLCLGRQPEEYHIQLLDDDDVIDGLSMIYDGNEDLKRNNIFFLTTEPGTNPKAINFYFDQISSLCDMGFKKEQFEDLLDRFNGNIPRIISEISK